MIGQLHLSPVDLGTTYTASDGRTFALCNGQAISRTLYPDLSILWPSGSYGSTDTDIHLPFMDGVHLRGNDYGRGVDHAPGLRTALSGFAPSGTQIGSYQLGNMESHVHPSGTYSNNLANTGGGGPNGGIGDAPTGDVVDYRINFPAQTSGATISGTTSVADFDLPHMKAYPYICTG